MVFLDGLGMELLAMTCSCALAWEVRPQPWLSGSLASAGQCGPDPTES